MLQHVEREMRRYRPDRHIRRQYQHIRAEAYELNILFRRGAQYYDRRRLRAQIAHMHSELHHIEEELHVPAHARYELRRQASSRFNNTATGLSLLYPVAAVATTT